MTIAGFERCLLFIAFFNPYLMINTDKIQLDKPLYLVQLVK